MNYDILTNELRNDPLGRGYAAMTDQEAADSLNVADRTVAVATFATWRLLLAELGPEAAATVKAKIDAAAGVNPAIAMAADMLKTYSDGGGLDIGHPYTRGVIDSLVASEVLTADEAAAIKAIAERTITRASELGLPRIDQAHVGSAKEINANG